MTAPALVDVDEPVPYQLSELDQPVGYELSLPVARAAHGNAKQRFTVEWVDLVAVDRAVAGDWTAPLNPSEVAVAFRRLHNQNLPGWRIAEILGVSLRQVERWRHGAQPRGRRRTVAIRVAQLEAELRAEKAKLRASSTGVRRATLASTIRAWAKSAGVDCPPRGQIPKNVRAAYEARHPEAAS